jgi:hypothetical protein
MKKHLAVFGAALCVLSAGLLFAAQPKERALWCEIKKQNGEKTTIAVTENIARGLLESDDTKFHFADKDDDVITREMLREVLDGEKDVVKAKDKDGSAVKIYMSDLKVPGHREGKLVLETYKHGNRTFRMALPEIEIGAADEDDNESADVSFGWRALLPSLAEEGGALYINNEEEETEVWIYLD